METQGSTPSCATQLIGETTSWGVRPAVRIPGFHPGDTGFKSPTPHIERKREEVRSKKVVRCSVNTWVGAGYG